MSRATLHESDMAFVIQWSGRSSHISAARWIAHQSPTAIVPVRLPGGQNPNSLFLLLRCYYRDVVNLWFKMSDRIGGRPNLAMSSDI